MLPKERAPSGLASGFCQVHHGCSHWRLSSAPAKMEHRARECWGRHLTKDKEPRSWVQVISDSPWHTVF